MCNYVGVQQIQLQQHCKSCFFSVTVWFKCKGRFYTYIEDIKYIVYLFIYAKIPGKLQPQILNPNLIQQHLVVAIKTCMWTLLVDYFVFKGNNSSFLRPHCHKGRGNEPRAM